MRLATTNKSRASGLLGLVVLLAAACGGRDGAAPATIAGKVVSANGRALAGATVAVLSPKKLTESLRQAPTGDEGEFELDGIAPGKYLLRAHAEGFSPASIPVELLPGERVGGLLRLKPVELLEGVVQDGQGRPLAQAALFAWPLGGRKGGVVESASGSDGRFALAGLTPGPWTLMVEAPGFGTLRLERVDVPARSLVLRLDGEARTLGGVVLGAGGAPVANARVILGGPGLSKQREVHSNAKGLFLFHGLGLGRFEIRATSERGASPAATVVIDEETGWMPPVKLEMREGARFGGRVIDDRGQPLPRAEVEIVSSPTDDTPEVTRTDGKGKFAMGPVLPGRYQIWARLPGHAMPAPVETQLRPGGNDPVEIRLSRVGTIVGRVVDEEGRPLQGVVVTAGAASVGVQDWPVLTGSLPLAAEAANLPAEALSRPGRLRSGVSDGGGYFTLPDLPPGKYVTEIAGPGRLPVRGGPVTVEPGKNIDLGKKVLRSGHPLTGRVVDEVGAVVAGAIVEARPMGMPSAAPFSTVTESDGTFSVHVSSGRFTITARASGRVPGVRDGVLAKAGEPPSKVELVVRPSDAVLRGQIRDPKGRAAPHARISAYALRGMASASDGASPAAGSSSGSARPEWSTAGIPALSSASSDRSGRFILHGVPREPFLLEVRHPVWPARTLVASPGDGLLVELPRPGAIEGEVRDRSSNAFLSHYRIETQGPDGRPAVDVRTQGAGFELRGLLPGTWRVRIHAKGYKTGEKTIEVPPGPDRDSPSVRGLRIDLSRESGQAAEILPASPAGG